MKIAELLLSWDEFNKKEHPQPYVYVIMADGKSLNYFGAQHILDPNHDQNTQIQEEWNKFIANTVPEKRKVVSEIYASGPFTDESHAIRERGESGLAVYLASKENIEVVVPRLTKQELMKASEGHFERNMILYHHALQVALHWNRLSDKPPFDQFIETFLTRDKEGTHWNNIDFTFEHIKNIHKKLFDSAFDEHDKEFFVRMTDPSQMHGMTNEISRDQNAAREVMIVEKIVELWNEGNSIFAILGSGHAVIEEPALRALLK